MQRSTFELEPLKPYFILVFFDMEHSKPLRHIYVTGTFYIPPGTHFS